MTRSLKVGLTAEQIAKRRYSLGGSDANTIMNADPPAILRLWEEKTGRAAPEDLSRVLPVQLGSWTEEFNRYWYELATGRLVYLEGQERTQADVPWRTCTLDGATTTSRGDPAIFEAKHVGPYQSIDDVVQRYMPQLHHNMAVCDIPRAVLSILIGNGGYETYEVESDFIYAAQLLDREREFWACVTENRPPHEMPNIAPPVPREQWRKVSMEGNNEWGSHAADWLANRSGAKTFENATKGIKGLMAADIGEATGNVVTCKRAKNGSLTIKEIA